MKQRKKILFKGLDAYLIRYTRRNVLSKDLKLMGLGAGELLRGILTSEHVSLTVSVSRSLCIVSSMILKTKFFLKILSNAPGLQACRGCDKKSFDDDIST